MPIPQTTPQEAQQLLQQGYRYLDVRTEEEFVNGHPAGAANVPVAMPDERTHQMALNPEFLKIVEATYAKDQPIVVGCQAGGRSQHAAEMMAAAGYQQVVNLQGGWGSWASGGYPVCKQCATGDSYEELRAKVS